MDVEKLADEIIAEFDAERRRKRKAPKGVWLSASQSARLAMMTQASRDELISIIAEHLRKRQGGKQKRKMTPLEWYQ